LLVNLPSPNPKALAHPSTPEVLQAREHAPTPYYFVIFTFGLTVESIKELRGASIVIAISLGSNGIMNVFTIFTFIMVVTMTVIIIVFNNGVTTSFLQ
jgi:hypothetical protein